MSDSIQKIINRIADGMLFGTIYDQLMLRQKKIPGKVYERQVLGA